MQMEQTPFHLSGKTILVTGASSGIGKQMVASLKMMGANVILSARNKERLSETAKENSFPETSIITADLTVSSERENLAKQIPQIDGLVQCAGTVHPFPVKFLDEAKMDQTMNVNFQSPVLLISALLKARKINSGASLVFLSSISADRPQKGATMYGASKAALEAFVKVLAQELSTQNIRANCIAPAMVKTPMFEKTEEMLTKEYMDAHVAKYLLGVGYPEDVANAAVFLLSPASRWITGISLTLDGGIMLV
jgi:NAD(P)-dependent dehydrogenase (short-subunit alcohol dehydrogenase family)